MNTAAHLAVLKARILTHADVATHSIAVISEAEQSDIETVIAQELTKGGLHIVVAAGGLQTKGDRAKGGMQAERTLVVTLAYIPGLNPPAVNVLSLSESLCEWLHGQASGGVWFSVVSEGAIPEEADVSGRQIIFEINDVLRAVRGPTT